MTTKYVLLFVHIALQFTFSSQVYMVPKARIDVLHPKGFSVSIPDAPGIQLYAFHGNLNQEMDGLEAGQFSQDILKSRSGRWVFTNRKHEIKPGDILYYWLYVQKDSLGYRRDDQRHEFTETDVYGNLNVTEEAITEPSTTERPETTTRPPIQKPINGIDDCNASTPTMRVTPQEIHHHHHHYLPETQRGSCGSGIGGNDFGGGNNNFGSTGQNGNDKENIRQIMIKLREMMVTLDSVKMRLATLSDVVDELINAGGSAKLLLIGAKLDATTNLFELVRHVVLDRLDLKDLRNDIYSATRTKDGVVFDVASGLDKRRILARARERFTEKDELRIQDYYDAADSKAAPRESEPFLDVRFGE